MTSYQAQATREIEAPADLVYGIIADYRDGHPAILPKRYFRDLEVEQGGVGAGSVISFRMLAAGNSRTFRAEITEPEPGRVLVESDSSGGPVTTFTVDPLDGGRHCRVTIATEGPVRPGLAGKLEGRLTKRMLAGIYRDELNLLAELALNRSAALSETTDAPPSS